MFYCRKFDTTLTEIEAYCGEETLDEIKKYVRKEREPLRKELENLTRINHRGIRHNDRTKRFAARIHMLTGGGRVTDELRKTLFANIPYPSSSTNYRTITQKRKEIDFVIDEVSEDNVKWALGESARSIKLFGLHDQDVIYELDFDEMALLALVLSGPNNVFSGLDW